MKFNIDIVENHLILLYRESRFLIDTGSPVSISKSSEIEIFNQPHATLQKVPGWDIDDFSNAIGSDIDGLIGGDILKHYQFQVNCQDRSFSILEPSSFKDLDNVDIKIFMGVPVIEIVLGRDQVRAFLDTGAKISYVNSRHVEGLNPIGKRKDFHPLLSKEFETLIYELPICFNHQKLSLTFGVLPQFLEEVLSIGDTEVIVGNDIFSHFSIIFDYSSKKLYCI